MAQLPQSSSSSRLNGKKWFIVALLCLLAALVAFFAPSFNPDKVLFANDGPLGAAMAKAIQPPDSMFGVWLDLNWIGNAGGTYVPSATFFLFRILRPLLFMKFYAPISLLFLGVSAWIFFRQLRLHPFVCLIGALAAMLNTNSFSNVCWGLGTRALSMGAIFLALAAFEASKRHRFPWIYLILGGIAVGIGVCEGADNGAIYSLFVAAYVAYSTWQERGRSAAGAGLGIARVAVVALFAGIMAAQAIGYLVPTAVKTVMHTKVTEETKQADWDFATTWSLPKAEVIRLLIPGIYGYRMDTPDGGQYWGRVGRSPGYTPGPGASPQGARHSVGANTGTHRHAGGRMGDWPGVSQGRKHAFGLRKANGKILRHSSVHLPLIRFWAPCPILLVHVQVAVFLFDPESHQVHAPVSFGIADTLWLRPAGAVPTAHNNAACPAVDDRSSQSLVGKNGSF